MNFEERRAELLAQMKALEKEERKAKSAELKAEQRKKNDFCKKEFGTSYKAIKELLSQENKSTSITTKTFTLEEKEAIAFWNDMLTRYNPIDKNDLKRHILSDRQVSYYQNM